MFAGVFSKDTPESSVHFPFFSPEMLVQLLPPQGFRLEAKSRGGTLVTRAYIKDGTYSSNIQSVY